MSDQDELEHVRATASRNAIGGSLNGNTLAPAATDASLGHKLRDIKMRRRPTTAPTSSTMITDVERGLTGPRPHFVTIPVVAGAAGRGPSSSQRQRSSAAPGWDAAKAQKSVMNGAANADRIKAYIPAVTRELAGRNLGQMPLALVLGWISQESSGRPGLVDDSAGLDEIGLFQISLAERQAYLGSTEPRMPNNIRHSMLNQREVDNVTAQLRGAATLMQRYRQMIAETGLSAKATVMPELIRVAHNAGIGTAIRIAGMVVSANREGRLPDPESMSWNELVSWVAGEKNASSLVRKMRSADYARLAGQEILRQASTTANTK